MSKYQYTGLQVNDGIVTVGQAANADDHEVILRVDDVRVLEIDWTVEAGRIIVGTERAGYAVTFVGDDGGGECADAINDLVTAMQGAP